MTSSTDVYGDKLSRIARSIEPSKTLAVTALANRLRDEGRDIISLTAGEPDFPTPALVSQAGIDAIQQGATRYTAAAGEPRLRERIAQVYAERWGVDVEAAQVCASSGAKPLLYYLLCVLLDPGDEVLFPRPYWVSYEAMVRMCAGVPVPIESELARDLKLDAESLRASLTERSKVILINNPTNPTGAVYDREELLALAELARERDLLIIADEIYEELVYGGLRHQSLYNLTPWTPERTTVVSGVSKSFAMTGWRLGYAIGDQGLIKTLAAYQSQALSSPSQISQRAALSALESGWPSAATMREAFEERLHFCLERIQGLGLPHVRPQAAFYLFFDVAEVCRSRGWEDGQEFCSHLLEDKGVALIPGDAFGMPQWVRLSFAASRDALEQGFDRLESFLA